MSASKPIPGREKGDVGQQVASSFPKEKTVVSRVSSAPIIPRDPNGFGAELRRRSDQFFNSFERFSEDECEPLTRSSTMSSEDSQGRRESISGSFEKPRIDDWLEWRKNRRNSSPVLTYNGQVGTSV